MISRKKTSSALQSFPIFLSLPVAAFCWPKRHQNILFEKYLMKLNLAMQVSALPFIIIRQQFSKVVRHFRNRELDVLLKNDCPKISKNPIQAIFHLPRGHNFITNILF